MNLKELQFSFYIEALNDNLYRVIFFHYRFNSSAKKVVSGKADGHLADLFWEGIKMLERRPNDPHLGMSDVNRTSVRYPKHPSRTSRRRPTDRQLLCGFSFVFVRIELFVKPLV